MSVEQSLAQASNVLVYSAMVVYTGAFGAFAADLARRGAPEPAAVADGGGTAVAARVPVVAGAVAGSPSAEASESPSGAVSESAARAVSESPSGGSAGAGGTAGPAGARIGGIALSLLWLAFGLHLAGVAARGAAVHRPPWGNMYEFATAGSVVVTGTFLALVARRKDLRYLGTFVAGPVLLTLGLAVTVLYARAGELVPALRSFWLGIHVSVAFVASALFTLAFSLTVLQLVQARREAARAAGNPPVRGRFMDGLPSSVELERSAYRLHVVAFPLWTFTIIAGAIWAESAWSRYWNWDPKEVWSFVIWVVYAGYLHARATRGWEGTRSAYLAIAGYGCVLFNFLVVNVFFPGMHSYSGLS